ncbi:MAG: ATP synthase subunit I [Burkholderiales bacterium]|jgi:F0F1-type ATP synthase assembly protein I|nr:ATP synthase subunit I [Burkholderiales bacterium]
MLKPLDVSPIKTVLIGQFMVTLASGIVFGWFFEVSGVISAALGGMVNMLANVAYAGAMKWGSRPMTAGRTLVRLFCAEAVKIAVMVVLLVLVLIFYRKISATAFFVTFILTAFVFAAALLTQSPKKSDSHER